MTKFSPKEWDEVRKKFRTSIMADTSLQSLAQNLEGEAWPVAGDEERPSKYIDFNYDELLMLPEIAGKAERVDLLIGILKETLAFDDPFGDMVAQVEETAAKENPILKTLARLGISEAFPLQLVNLSDATRAVCASEGVKTIGEFANLAQQMSTRVVIGGDFRRLLNALSHSDEAGIGEFLPFRKGANGLHLPEALGLAVAELNRADQVALANALGARLPAELAATPANIDNAKRDALERQVRLKVDAALAWFTEQADALRGQLRGGATLERFLVPINDPVREAIAARVTRSAIGVPDAEVATTASTAKKGGLFSRLFGRG